jgi:flagellar protein FliO/FliZ
MAIPDIAQYLLSLFAVLALIGALAYGSKRFGLVGKLRHNKSLGGHMEVVDVLYLDARRRLMLVKCKDKEYMILLAGDTAQFLTHQNGENNAALS